MSKRILVVGDSTTHGGKVISSSPDQTINGKAVARLNDLVDCPQNYPDDRPHGINKIIEGDLGFTISRSRWKDIKPNAVVF